MRIKSAIIGIIVSLFGFAAYFSPVYAVGSADSGQSTFSPSEVAADGNTESHIQIILRDSSGNTLGGDAITIAWNDQNTQINDRSQSNSPITTSLDGSGAYNFMMKSTTVGQIQITVSDTTNGGSISWNVTFDQPGSNTPTPTITPTPQPGTCSDSAPGSAPSLTSAVSSGAHAVTLTWNDASDPVSYYELSYGLSSGNYIYGAPNIGGQGTTTFTVGGLTTGKTYYFSLRAVNGCMPGSASNELSGIAGEAPTPTPSEESTTTDETTQDNTPTDTPELAPSDTPTPLPTPEASATDNQSGGSSMIGKMMIGVTVVGIVCVLIGGILYIKLKKKTTP